MQDISIDKPIFMIGMPRSGTSVLSEALSLHEDLGWISNYVQQFPYLPCLSILNRFADIPLIGLYMRGKKKQEHGFFPSVKGILPYSIEAFSVWELFFGKRFSFDYLIDKKPRENESEKARSYVKKNLNLTIVRVNEIY